MTIKFVDELPPDGRSVPRERTSKYKRWAAELSKQPGSWGVVATFPVDRRKSAQTLMGNIKRSRVPLDAATRTVGEECIVYARYVEGSSD